MQSWLFQCVLQNTVTLEYLSISMCLLRAPHSWFNQAWLILQVGVSLHIADLMHQPAGRQCLQLAPRLSPSRSSVMALASAPQPGLEGSNWIATDHHSRPGATT
jgi:hypothetical protein